MTVRFRLRRSAVTDQLGLPAPIAESLYALTVGRHTTRLSVEVVVFSRDRALQLDALLRSFARHVRGDARVTVVFRTTGSRHEASYEEVKSRSPWARFVREAAGRLQDTVFDVLSESPASHLLFLVDDDLFINPVDLVDLLQFDCRDFVPSLRLGTHLTQCYPMRREQALPAFRVISENGPRLLTWPWSGGELDWGYPLSLDGHLFSRREIAVLLSAMTFTTPNGLEAELQRAVRFFRSRRGVCYSQARLLNVPWNRVQTDHANRHAGLDQEDFLSRWEGGLQINVEAYRGMLPVSCHQEVELALQARREGPLS